MVHLASLAFAAYGCEGLGASPASVAEQGPGFLLQGRPMEVDPL